MRERSLSVARMQARRIAWQFDRDTSLHDVVEHIGLLGEAERQESPEDAHVGLAPRKAPLPWRISRKPRLASDRKSLLSTGRDTRSEAKLPLAQSLSPP